MPCVCVMPFHSSKLLCIPHFLCPLLSPSFFFTPSLFSVYFSPSPTDLPLILSLSTPSMCLPPPSPSFYRHHQPHFHRHNYIFLLSFSLSGYLICFCFQLYILFYFPLLIFNLKQLMESQQQLQNDLQEGGGGGGGSGKGGSSNYLCRQSSSRWTPTTEQIRILKELYYNNGVRSPTADQIQRISARLRQYGKIEGKNVFYWFQNHKARERQKKRFTNTLADQIPNILYNKYPLINTTPPGVPTPSSSSCSTSSSPAMVAVGQMGSHGYGSLNMEKSFRDWSISAGCNGGGGTIGHNFWVGGNGTGDPHSQPYPFLEYQTRMNNAIEVDDEEDHEDHEQPQIETLPLFPMHADNLLKPEISPNDNWFQYYSDHRHANGYAYANTSSRTSLELSLNSYAGMWSSD